ncbi:MAG: biotin transporter BioY, partial [Bacteroidales bacterium]|nr:biotin transporter BioY [Bacteroidales bacterium]
MKKTLFFILAMILGGSLMAQEIGENELAELRASFNNDSYAKSIHNIIVTNKGIKALAYDPSVAQGADDFFKYSVDVNGITDQKSSGRCWMFTSMNHLRPAAMKKYNLKNFDFSHNYSYFWDILEKANLFLENVISTSNLPFGDRTVDNLFRSPVGDGGVWNLFYNIGEKYGVVPAEVMPETEQSNSTGQFLGIVNERLRKGGYEIRQIFEKAKTVMMSGIDGDPYHNAEKKKMATLKDVYRILAICLGEPPTEFTWKYRDNDGKVQTVKMTPKEFYKSIVPADYNSKDFVMIMNDPTREYYKLYEIDNYRNTIEGINWIYLNLPNDV